MNQLSIFGDLDSSENTLTLSAKWASKIIDCTAAGICGGCHGLCCRTPKYWPAMANGGVCFHLGDAGCKLEDRQKPVKCLLYPFVIKNGKLILHGRALLGTCKPNYKKGERSILENMRNLFVSLFGEEVYARIFDDLINHGRDSRIIIPDNIVAALAKEDTEETDNKIPAPR